VSALGGLRRGLRVKPFRIPAVGEPMANYVLGGVMFGDGWVVHFHLLPSWLRWLGTHRLGSHAWLASPDHAGDVVRSLIPLHHYEAP